jgi:hypothetical protein
MPKFDSALPLCLPRCLWSYSWQLRWLDSEAAIMHRLSKVAKKIVKGTMVMCYIYGTVYQIFKGRPLANYRSSEKFHKGFERQWDGEWT